MQTSEPRTCPDCVNGRVYVQSGPYGMNQQCRTCNGSGRVVLVPAMRESSDGRRVELNSRLTLAGYEEF